MKRTLHDGNTADKRCRLGRVVSVKRENVFIATSFQSELFTVNFMFGTFLLGMICLSSIEDLSISSALALNMGGHVKFRCKI